MVVSAIETLEINPNLLPELFASIDALWIKVYQDKAMPHQSLNAYKELMKYGFLGCIDQIIRSADPETGVVFIGGLQEKLSQEPARYREDQFKRAHEAIKEHNSDLLSLMAQLG